MRLGFFDSGLGGLLMMESCRKHYPNHEYIYVGDTQNLPYGPRTAEEIEGFMSPYLLWLLNEKECNYVVIACNTASVKALPIFQKKYPEYASRIINIVDPTCTYLQENIDADQSLVVLATQGTVKSMMYNNQGIQTQQIPMPGLVDLIESDKKDAALSMVRDALSYYQDVNVVLLGCTHYSWLTEDLQKMNSSIEFISQDKILHNIIASFPVLDVTEAPEYYISEENKLYTESYNIEVQILQLKNND